MNQDQKNINNQTLPGGDTPTGYKEENYTQRIVTLEKLASDLNDRQEKADRRSDSMFNLVILGFVVLIVMVVSIILGYLEFTYSGSRNDDYKYELSDKISSLQIRFDMFKGCLKSGGWNSCLIQ